MPSHSSFHFGVVGSPISTPKKPGGSIGGIHRLAELELFALELGWVRSVRISEKSCEELRQAAIKCSVLISVHAPYYINLNANEEEWPKSRQRLMDAAYFGGLAGATDIVFHPGSYFGQTSAQVLPKAIDRLQGCCEELVSRGVQVTLRPETMGKSAMLGSLEDVIAMSRAMPGVLPCLDIAHLHARAGDGSMNSFEEWLEVLNIYQSELGKGAMKNLHIHLSGIEYGEKGERNHLPLGEADLDLEAILQALWEMDCGGRILCESPAMEDDAMIMRDAWSKMFPVEGNPETP